MINIRRTLHEYRTDEEGYVTEGEESTEDEDEEEEEEEEGESGRRKLPFELPVTQVHY
jgi:hypothetical protein